MAVDKLVDSTQLDSDLTSVANAIRTKGGTSASLAFPAGFVSAVQAIPTGVTPTGTKNISITANGQTTEDVTNYASAQITANVPNTYAAGDEGKVVSSGALVSQTSRNIDTNGTYDTTTNNEVVVNVSGGGGDSYVFVEYINATATNGVFPYIYSDITPAMIMAKDLKFTYKVRYLGTNKTTYGPHLLSAVNCMLPLLRRPSTQDQLFYNLFGVGNDGQSQPYSLNTDYTFVYDFASNTFTLNGNSVTMLTPGSAEPQTNLYFLSYSSSPGTNTIGNVRLYDILVEKNGEVFRHYYPVARTSDIRRGLYESVTGTFFQSVTAADFVAGPIVASPLAV